MKLWALCFGFGVLLSCSAASETRTAGHRATDSTASSSGARSPQPTQNPAKADEEPPVDFQDAPGGRSSDCSSQAHDADFDHDGWSAAQGDCNDCEPTINPGALDYPDNKIDEDCDGTADDSPALCDGNLLLDSVDGLDAARAIGLCQMQQGERWGVVSSEYVTSDGLPLANFDAAGIGHGLLRGFGDKVKPLEGERMMALSSGAARNPTDPGYESVGGDDKKYTTSAPAGYPKESPACPGTKTGQAHDSVGLKVRLRTPSNAKSLRFNLDFYTYEFPIFVCSSYNDFFVALLDPIPKGQPDGNISFDDQGNTISVNATFLQVCKAQTTTKGRYYPCEKGADELLGTGFELSAATGWLQTAAPIEKPGSEITLLLTVWDSGDGILDSTVLIDNFTFEPAETKTETQPVKQPH